MSERHSPFRGWRARTHYLTRNREFLLRTSAMIIALGLVAASLLVAARRQEDGHAPPRSAEENTVHRHYHALRTAPDPQPRELARLLRQLLKVLLTRAAEDAGPRAHAGFLADGSLGGYDIAPLLQQHSTAAAPASLFQDFLSAALAADAAAFGRMEEKALATPPAMLASEFYGYLQKQQGDEAAAAHSFFREGLQFPDASISRQEVVRLAIVNHDFDLLRTIAQQPGWIDGCPPRLQLEAGAMLNDVWLQWHSLVALRLNDIPYSALALTLFAAALWYFILVEHSDHGHWRWVRPLPAVMAGVLSIWPTVTLVYWQEYTQGMTADAPFPHDLIYYVLGVGLREEGCKLALFALFLPWLLWRRRPGLALLTGAFVGLGFALEENINYYESGGGVAWGRFVSANFLHIAMTAICAHGLYEMLRTRFARADQFLIAFGSMVAAHGGYDWFLGTGEHAWLATVVLVLTVSRFIDLLGQETRPFRLTVSPRAVFTLGSALLIAIAFISGAWTTRSMNGVADAGLECIAMVPVALLYWRKFEHA